MIHLTLGMMAELTRALPADAGLVQRAGAGASCHAGAASSVVLQLGSMASALSAKAPLRSEVIGEGNARAGGSSERISVCYDWASRIGVSPGE